MSAPIGLFGGAFDPVHRGHIDAALAALAALALARIDFLPAAQSPLKSGAAASGQHRLAMLELAISGKGGLGVDPRELSRPGPSFTIDTLVELRSEHGPEQSLVWIVGSDILASLSQWKRWRELVEYAHVLVLDRPHAPECDASVEAWLERHSHPAIWVREKPSGSVQWLHQPPVDVSSTEIRAALKPGGEVGSLLCDQVIEYIAEHELYELEPS